MAVVAMPILLTFLFAAIDLGRVVFLGAEAGTAAHAVCRRVAARPASASSSDELREAAVEAAPSLAGEGLDLSIDVDVGDVEECSFAYRLYDDEADSFLSRTIRTRTRPVEASVAVRGRYLTPLGTLLSKGADGAAFSCSAQARGVVDETAEET